MHNPNYWSLDNRLPTTGREIFPSISACTLATSTSSSLVLGLCWICQERASTLWIFVSLSPCGYMLTWHVVCLPGYHSNNFIKCFDMDYKDHQRSSLLYLNYLLSDYWTNTTYFNLNNSSTSLLDSKFRISPHIS